MELNRNNFDKLKMAIDMAEDIPSDKLIVKLKKYSFEPEINNLLINNLQILSSLIERIETNNMNNISEEQKETLKKIKRFVYITNPTFVTIRDTTLSQFKKKERSYKSLYPQKELVYPNQRETAIKILREFNDNNKKAVTLVALPQVGKTGTFLCVAIEAILEPDDSQMFKPENIFIVTGLSDTEWVKQTKGDMTDELNKNVYHLNTLRKLIPIINSKSNTRILIIIDECHIATSKDQTMDDIFKRLNMEHEVELNGLFESITTNNCINFLNVSATPSAILYEMDKWGRNHSIVYLEPPPTYIGFQVFLDENRIEDIENNEISNEFLDGRFKTIVDARFRRPKYHIFRISGIRQTDEVDKHRRTIINTWSKNNNYDVLNYDASTKNAGLDIEKVLNREPSHHTFILIKNFWRAGKRMNDAHIGVVYEFNEVVNVDITAQGLIGRFCGNDKRKLPDVETPYFFCNVEAIREYLLFINNGCNLLISNYNSNKLRVNDGVLNRVELTCFQTLDCYQDGVGNLIEKNKYIDIPYDMILDENIYQILKKTNHVHEQLESGQRKQVVLENILKYNPDLHQKIKNYICERIFIAGAREEDEEEKNKSYTKHVIEIRECIEANKYMIPNSIKKFKDKKYTNFFTCTVDKRSRPRKILIQVYTGSILKTLIDRIEVEKEIFI